VKTSSRDVVGRTRRAGGSQQTFDVIIVGGGSAGAVSRGATERRWRNARVLLLEGGPEFSRPTATPPVLSRREWSSAGSPTFDWKYHTEDSDRLGHDVPVPPRPRDRRGVRR